MDRAPHSSWSGARAARIAEGLSAVQIGITYPGSVSYSDRDTDCIWRPAARLAVHVGKCCELSGCLCKVGTVLVVATPSL